MTTLETLRATLLASMGGAAAFERMFSARTFRSNRSTAELDAADQEAAQAFAAIAAACAAQGRDDLTAELQAQWLARFVRLWIVFQHAGARTANWAVTGPANFPVERNRKRMETEHRRLTELLEHGKGACHWASRRCAIITRRQSTPCELADGALDDARARLAARQQRQERMRAANAASPKSRPYAAYQLSNNSAEIRRIAARVAELERKAAAVHQVEAADTAPAASEINGVELLENIAADRLQLRFPGRPAPAVIDRLKQRGFRWSPREGAWQRQLTNNARDAARWILAAV